MLVSLLLLTDDLARQLYWSFIQGVVSEYASIPKKLEIDEEGGYVGLVVGISNTVAQDWFQILSCDAYHRLHRCW